LDLRVPQLHGEWKILNSPGPSYGHRRVSDPAGGGGLGDGDRRGEKRERSGNKGNEGVHGEPDYS